MTPSGPELVLVSSRYRDPGVLPPDPPAPPSWAPRTYRGAELDGAVRQGGKVFLVYEGRYLLGATARNQAVRYAFDFTAFTRPPNRGELEPVTWAREVDGVLYLSAGYGFTAEPDFLYLLDRRTGDVLDRLTVPSAPEIIKLRGDLLHVRTYDRQLVVRLRR